MAEEVKVDTTTISLVTSKASGKGGAVADSRGSSVAINPSTGTTVDITEGAG